MTAFVALLRAVNVGGTGKLPMSDLKSLCEQAGFTDVETYIASGNAVFRSEQPEVATKAALEAALGRYAGKPVGVLVRTATEMAAVRDKNPFRSAAPNRTVAIFLDGSPPSDVLAGVTGRDGEEIGLGAREIYVRYGDDMGRSRLRIPAARHGTARNMRTVANLADIAKACQDGCGSPTPGAG